MKKIARLLAYGLFLALIFVASSCEKDLIPEEPINIGSKPLIKIDISKEVVDFNGSSSLSFEFANVNTNNGDSISINGLKLKELSGNVQLKELKRDTTFVFFAENKQGEVSEIRKITVRPQTFLPPVIVLSFSPTILPIGGGRGILTFEGSLFDSVFFEGKWYLANENNITTEIITEDTILTLTAKGPGGLTNASVNVYVEQPPVPFTANQDMASGPWSMFLMEEAYDKVNGPWTEVPINYSDACMIDDFWHFYLSPNKYCSYEQGLLCTGVVAPLIIWGSWTLNDNILSGPGGFETKEVTFHSQTLMVWILTGSETNLQTGETVIKYFRQSFRHPNTQSHF